MNTTQMVDRRNKSKNKKQINKEIKMMMLESGMQHYPIRDVENLDRDIVHEVEHERKIMMGLASIGEWNSVLKKLSQGCHATSIFHLLPMNSSKDTLVHLAASEGQTKVVKELLLLIKKDHQIVTEAPLANVTGNTPLHLAAANGHDETCRLIVEVAPELCRVRNVDGETPIFVAALSGYMNTFSTLNSVPREATEIALVRRSDGDTILHCAVSGEYFDLASVIIESYQQLVYYRNERGLTPLHILANNPSAFRSGCRLQLLNRFLYSSIKVSTESKIDDSRQKKEEDYPCKLAGNYLLCWTFFKLLRCTFATLGQSLRPRRHQRIERQTSHVQCCCFERFFRFILMALQIILALSGFSRRLTKMRKKKHKHIWADKVMKQILCHIEHWWDFGEINTGMDPYRFRFEVTRGMNPVTVGETSIALQLEKEIASASETSSILEIQKTPIAESTLYDPSSSSIPRTDSSIQSSFTGASSDQRKEEARRGFIESPFLIAGKKGVKEMVEAILSSFPMAIHDTDLQQKNIIMLAAEHRQPEIYVIFLKRKTESWFGKVDVDGNSVLHLAARHPDNQPLLIPGAALQMQREIKWFKFVKENMPPHFSKRQNHKGETAMEVFTETHKDLAVQRAKWLSNASQSCSVVATLITTVAFATIASVPGGVLQDHGAPVLQGRLAFNVFSVSSLFALCSSAISLIMFLGILTSPYQDLDFGNQLPKKLIFGLGSLFISIATMFLSFFSGDLFVLESRMKYMAYPIFIVTTCVALAAFPLYFEFIKQTMTRVPERTYPHKLSF